MPPITVPRPPPPTPPLVTRLNVYTSCSFTLFTSIFLVCHYLTRTIFNLREAWHSTLSSPLSPMSSSSLDCPWLTPTSHVLNHTQVYGGFQIVSSSRSCISIILSFPRTDSIVSSGDGLNLGRRSEVVTWPYRACLWGLSVSLTRSFFFEWITLAIWLGVSY